jgi:hypothetical protein
MSTWHQNQNPVPLWHVSKWTVVCDAYGKHMTVTRWNTADEAQADAGRTKGFVLAPAPDGATD